MAQQPNVKVFMDISIDGHDAGRIDFELYTKDLPLTTENFRTLCTGEKGNNNQGIPLHYLSMLSTHNFKIRYSIALFLDSLHKEETSLNIMGGEGNPSMAINLQMRVLNTSIQPIVSQWPIRDPIPMEVNSILLWLRHPT